MFIILPKRLIKYLSLHHQTSSSLLRKYDLVDLVVCQLHLILLVLPQEEFHLVSPAVEVCAADSEVAVELLLALLYSQLCVSVDEVVPVIDHPANGLVFLLHLRVVPGIVERVALQIGQRKQQSFLVHWGRADVLSRVEAGHPHALHRLHDRHQVAAISDKPAKAGFGVSFILEQLFCFLYFSSHVLRNLVDQKSLLHLPVL
jgi:hypothetical protein